MKKMNNPDNMTSPFKREIKFCENYAHRCLTKFYGFITYKEKITGFIYEYMANDSLSTYIKKNKGKVSELFSLMTINRIFQGINFLHSNSLIHRDIKPSNILIDHDFVPFISDYETIRPASDENVSADQMTGDIGSQLYTSPEQDKGDIISYQTDIYSFGLILYFLSEKKHMRLNENLDVYFKKDDDPIPEMTNFDKELQNLYEQCVQYNPEKRPNIQKIRSVIMVNFNLFKYLEKCLLMDQMNKSEIVQFLYENIILIDDNQDEYSQYYLNIISFIKVFLLKNKGDTSSFLLKLGDLYNEENVYEKNYLKARYYYELSAQLNNSTALLYLGDFYYFGLGVDKNFAIAKKYYEDSFRLNNQFAAINLGNLYLHGKGVKKDFNEAKKYFEISAKQNNSVAFLKLGDLYYYGDGVKQSYTKAFEYYKLSAEHRNQRAILRLADMYYFGDGVEQDYSKSIEYYTLLAKENNSEAIYQLGNMYYEGKGFEKNCSKAMEYYELAARRKNSNAYLKLGDIYYFGNYVKQDYLKSKYYYELAAQFENPKAFTNLGYLYFDGNGVKKDLLKAQEYFELAASFDESEALFSLGHMYHKGIGVKQDYLKAIEYYELAGQLNNSEALSNLGNMYQFGEGVKQNYYKAKECYELAAKLNDSFAFNNLGNLYRDGLGVERDYLKAKYYFEIASNGNFSDAFNNLGNLYLNGQGVKQDYLIAKEYYELAETRNNSDAIINIGYLYYKGLGVKQDYLKAKQYFEKAGRYGNSDGLNNLADLYFNGFGVQKDYLKVKECYELSAQMNNTTALFFLGYLNSTGDILDVNISESIHYYLRCVDLHNEKKIIVNSIENSDSISNRYNKYYYRANNDLGLIYITVFNDIEKANKYIKESGLNEYPFGQNNLALLYQFYFNKLDDAEYFYGRAAKNNFSMSEYNLGYINEIKGNVEKSIEFYIKASDHEDEPLLFHGTEHNDSRLNISKTFIICFTNLKLTDYFLSLSNYDESKKYFVKSFQNLRTNNENESFQFPIESLKKKTMNMFSYMKKFILSFPLFNLENQPYLISNTEINSIFNESNFVDNYKDIKKESNEMELFNDKFINYYEKIEETKNIIFNESEKNDSDDRLYINPANLFDFAIKEEKTKSFFIDEIHEIIDIMKSILYTPPYSILFGRISFEKPYPKSKETESALIKDINDSFYEGFNLDIN